MTLIGKMFRTGLKTLLFIMFLTLCYTCSILTFAMVNTQQKQVNTKQVVSGKDFAHKDIAELLYADNLSFISQNGGYHGLDGYKGYDFSTFCGATLYSPLPSTGVVKYNGLDGYIGPFGYKDKDGDGYKETAEENTMITIVGEAGTVTMFHGIYDIAVGTEVVGGITPIGKEASRGNSTGCHSHIIWTPNEAYFTQNQNYAIDVGSITHTGKHGNYGSVLPNYNDTKLRVSHYIPSQGGTNCDSDCTTMASGDKVAEWLIGKNGIKAMACPQEWPFGTRIMLSNQVYECRDRGGWINCYDVGDYDPALKSNATEKYCWVDLLSDGAGYSYGDFAIDWNFVK